MGYIQPQQITNETNFSDLIKFVRLASFEEFKALSQQQIRLLIDFMTPIDSHPELKISK
jgi:hypothetical protein